MSQAESVTPVYQAVPAQLPANHLADTLLPVRPALVDRGSVARSRPGMV
ncbi:MAG: NADH pyrophosphatase, partial [Actinomycetes bacterium]